MYPPKHFTIGTQNFIPEATAASTSDNNNHNIKLDSAIIRLIEQNPLATLIVQQKSATSIEENSPLHISHIPCHFNYQHNKETPTLIAHVSNQHPLAQQLMTNAQENKANVDVHLVFHGAQGYISPNDVVPQDRAANKVPTWNYCKVQLRTIARAVSNEEEKYRLMTQSSNYFERNSNPPWLLTDMPKKAIHQMLGAITFLELTLTHIEGNFKLSQNKPRGITEQLAKQQIAQNNTALAKQMLMQYRS